MNIAISQFSKIIIDSNQKNLFMLRSISILIQAATSY